MWWEVVCEKNQKLSRKNAKDQLKNELKKNSKPALMKFFNQPVPTTASLKLNINENEGVFSGDSNNAQRDQMLDVFCNLDKELGNQARDVFGMGPVEEKSFIQKVKGLLTGSKPELKRTNSMGAPKNRPNLETVEQIISSDAAPQPGEASAPGGKYPAIPSMNGKEKNIENILSSYGVPKDADTKAINKKSQEYKNTNNAILAIKRFVNYTGNHRAEFLVKVAECVGIKGVFVAHKKEIEYNNNDKKYIKLKITSILDKIKDLPKEYQTSYLKNGAVLLIRKIRNIIVVGLSYIASRNSMPEKEMK